MSQRRLLTVDESSVIKVPCTASSSLSLFVLHTQSLCVWFVCRLCVSGTTRSGPVRQGVLPLPRRRRSFDE
jgi:hypothetical protein